MSVTKVYRHFKIIKHYTSQGFNKRLSTLPIKLQKLAVEK